MKIEQVIVVCIHISRPNICDAHTINLIYFIFLAPWEPCLMRHFNRSVGIPNMVDVALALSADNMFDLGTNLLNIVSNVKAFVGKVVFTNCTVKPKI